MTTTGLMRTFYPIRKATRYDLSRIAEIYVFNNRINYFPIFNDESFSFGKLQVISLADQYFGDEEVLKNLYVYEDGLIKGFTQTEGTEICKLYVEPFFQSEGIGSSLIEFAIREFHADHLWVLERNTRAIRIRINLLLLPFSFGRYPLWIRSVFPACFPSLWRISGI